MLKIKEHRNVFNHITLSLCMLTYSVSAMADTPVTNAYQYGQDPKDGTRILQQAIDSGAEVVFIPNPGEPWITAPLSLRDNLTLIFEEGTVIQAKEGEFKDLGANLISARDKSNITIIGNGAILKMNKEEYLGDDHKQGEWRHVVGLYGCSDVYIENITVQDSGGDGFYLGSGRWTPRGQPGIPGMPLYCKNITIRGVVSQNNLRQGISIITGKNILLEDSVLKDTYGAAPMAGIDIEPNNANDILENIVIRNVESINNHGSGFEIHVKKLNETSKPISILFENCRAIDNHGDGFSLHGPGSKLQGLVELVDFTVEGSGAAAINVREKPAESFELHFKRAYFSNVAKRMEAHSKHPIWFQVRQKETDTQGGILFTDCVLEDNVDRPFFVAERQGDGNSIGISNIEGNITIISPYRPEIQLGSLAHSVNLSVHYEE